MSRQASILSAIATLALSLGALAPTSGTAQAAGACNAAPKPTAPAGSHWYYRTDRAAGRKCWYLAAEGSKGRIAAPRVAATPDTDADAEPAAPPMAEVAARLTQPLLSPPPAAAAPVSTIVSQAAPSAPLVPQADAVQRSDEPASAPLAQQAATNAQSPYAADRSRQVGRGEGLVDVVQPQLPVEEVVEAGPEVSGPSGERHAKPGVPVEGREQAGTPW